MVTGEVILLKLKLNTRRMESGRTGTIDLTFHFFSDLYRKKYAIYCKW